MNTITLTDAKCPLYELTNLGFLNVERAVRFALPSKRSLIRNGYFKRNSDSFTVIFAVSGILKITKKCLTRFIHVRNIVVTVLNTFRFHS